MIDVIFQNDDFMVVDKPAGMNFHSEDGVAGVIARLQEQMKLDTVYPVHRLDRMTSGLLIVALNKGAANQFLQLFSQRKIQKYYLAVSDKKPKKKQGWVKGDMQTSRNGSWKLTKSMQSPAVTQFISTSVQPGERLYLLKPKTGRTHQLRVALKSISAPICGDSRYANKLEAEKEERGYLHAFALKFELNDESFHYMRLPRDGQRFLTDACRGKIDAWSTPWSLM